MNRRRTASLFGVVTLFATGLLPVPATAQSARSASSPAEIEYAYPSQSVWTARLDSRGEPDNPLLRLADVLFRKAGIPWHGAGYPATRMFENLRNGTSEFSMLVRASALQECCLVGRKPVTSTELRVYSHADAPPVRSKEDLVGRSVITIQGYSYGGLLAFIADRKNNIGNNVAATHDAAFAMLERKRADYLIDYTGPSTEILALRPIKNLRHDVLDRLDVYLVLSKKRPDAEKLMNRLEAIVESLDTEEILWGRPK